MSLPVASQAALKVLVEKESENGNGWDGDREKLSRLQSKAVEINKQAGEMAAEHLGFITAAQQTAHSYL